MSAFFTRLAFFAFLSTVIMFFSFSIFDTAFASDETAVTLEHVNVNINDTASILRGAKLFAGTCMTCHTAKYLIHNKLANEAGITADKMPLNQKEWLYGITPPDLSLEARVRGADWIYTYLHSFYKDPSRPTGFNNLLVPNSVMTNIVAGMQGIQEQENAQAIVKPIFGNPLPHYYQILKLIQAGSQSPEEFDETTRDLTNFLVYASDPHAAERKSIGIYVLLFLALFFIVVYALLRYLKKA